MNRILAAVILCLLIAGCATRRPLLPDGYTGATASIADSGVAEAKEMSRLFFVEAVDGKRPERRLMASHNVSYHEGGTYTLAKVSRRVAAQPMRLKLVGVRTGPTLFQAVRVRARGAYRHVEGEIVFTPSPGGDYTVTGELGKEGSSVWLMDSATGKRVSEVIVSK
jgi:hypothetical protein